MNDNVVSAFKQIGADVIIGRGQAFAINIRNEVYQLTIPEAADVYVPDVKKKDRRMLLVVREENSRGQMAATQYLVGYDESHWFVSTVRNATNVRTAMETLIPPQMKGIVSTEDLGKHKAPGWRRQGEWFFVPVKKNFSPDAKFIHKGEPIQRDARSTAHLCEFLYRGANAGAQQVFIARGKEFRSHAAAAQAFPDLPLNEIRTRTVVTEVFVKGRISHPDHKTIVLTKWHRVYLNGEMFQGGGNRFLD